MKSVRARRIRPGAVGLSWTGEHELGYGPLAAWSLPSSVHGSPRNPRGRVRSLSLTSDDSAVPVLRHARCRGILRSLCRRRAPTSRYSHPRLPFLLCETEHPNPNLVLLFDAMMPTRLLILQAFLAKKKNQKNRV